MKTHFLAIIAIAGMSACLTAGAQSAADRSVRLTIDTSSPEYLSPYIFGHNLEHTRAAVNNGLSAQMLRNRKFAGKPSRNCGLASHWFGIGEKTLFYLDEFETYTRHICLENMRRRNEIQSQTVQNMTAGVVSGMGQSGIAVEAGRSYSLRTVTKVSKPLTLNVEIAAAEGDVIYASKQLRLTPSEEWSVTEFEMVPSLRDDSACIRYTFTEQAEICFGALSMMPSDHFHGMRSDVVAHLKAIGPTILRWPGGNFAGEYRWKDGLLDADARGPLCAATEIETQPYTDGFDYHEINTDDFIALCREVGAEPFLTINLAWSTPEESAQWIEYCNGSADTEYGRIRAERGFTEPYDVKFWSLGNEMGFHHMEGPVSPSEYTSIASAHAEALLKNCPDIRVFASGPYPNEEWTVHSGAVLADKAPYLSFHWYSRPTGFHYTTGEEVRDTYEQIVATAETNFTVAETMRKTMDRTGVKMHISFDEWNQWYSWYRPSCTGEGIFTAKFINGIVNSSTRLDIPVCCYFQPVGEGAIMITPTSSRLSANGQVFSLMKAHQGGRMCPVTGDSECRAAATLKDGVLTVTLVNDSYDRAENMELAVKGKVRKATLLSCEDIRPYTYFTESELEVIPGKKSLKTTLPPHSIASIEIELHR